MVQSRAGTGGNPGLNGLLMEAAQGGDLDAVKTLIKRGANVDAEDNNYETSLHAASREGHLDVVEHLVFSGAYIEAKDWSEWTPLHYASYAGHLKVVKYLVSNGANMGAKSKTGKTALSLALEMDKADVSKYLRKARQQKKKVKQPAATAEAMETAEGGMPTDDADTLYREHNPFSVLHDSSDLLENESQWQQTAAAKIKGIAGSPTFLGIAMFVVESTS
eukprot:jgi/Mesvir1/7828/Mv11769-RA.1